MPKTPRSNQLENRTRRLKLEFQKEPHWQKVAQGVFLGYYRPTGTWWVRKLIPHSKRYTKAALGSADDSLPANNVDVFNYFQAADRARSLANDQARIDNDAPIKPATIADAVDRYWAWFLTARKSHSETRNAIDAHILPELGGIPLNMLTAARLRNWLDKIAKAPARIRAPAGEAPRYRPTPDTDEGKRARMASANRVFNVLRAILNYAFTHGLVADDTEWRKVKAFPRADEPVTRFLTDAESQRLINACRADLRRLVKSALFTGARFSELTGLRCADFNTDTALLYIRPGKSGKGRHVPLNAQGLDFLKAATTGKEGADLIFTRADGEPWGKNHHVRPLAEACAAAKISPPITFHDLRHTYASLLAQAGADLLTISKLLGHADTRITSRHYAHLCDATLSNAVRDFLPGFGHKPEKKVRAIRH